MNIKLFVITHRNVEIPTTQYLVPIRSDCDNGDNIHELEGYCELRAQYWVWKNCKEPMDFVGFFHYRRYLDFGNFNLLTKDGVIGHIPYRIKKFPDSNDYCNEHIEKFLENIDIIAPCLEYTGLTPLENYSQAKGHCIDHLQLVQTIIMDKFPEYSHAATVYLQGTGEYYGNIFIMRKPIFDQYALWLFSILGEFDKRVGCMLPRTQGYLGERLFGIYYTWLKNNPNIRYTELPRVHFWGYDERNDSAIKKHYFLNCLIKPGGHLRGLLKRAQFQIERRRNN